MSHTTRNLAVLSMLLGAIGLTGCGNTKWAERKANEPYEDTPFAGFDKGTKSSQRKTPKYENVSDDTDPSKAVDQLVDKLQSRERHVCIPAEDELRYWASKQGVAVVVANKVRPLLKNPRIEVRAPALRLTIAYGKKDSLADLVEVLDDSEYGMRSAAFKALKTRAGSDFGYNPSGGDLARAQSIEKWRQWLKSEQNGPVKEEKAGEKEKEISENVEPKSGKAPASAFVLPKEDPQPKAQDTAKADPPSESILPAPKGVSESR